MFKKLLESLDSIAQAKPVKKANESKKPWLDSKDRPGAKEGDADGKKAEWKKYKADSASKDADSKDKKKEAVEEAVTLSADGEEAMELINGMRKLAGMSPVAGSLSPVPALAAAPVAAAPAPEAPLAPVTPEPAPPVSNGDQVTAAFAALPADSWDDEDDDTDDEDDADDDEKMVVDGEADDDEDDADDDEDDEEVKEAGNASIYANSPDESTQDASAVTGSGGDMHKKKKGYPAAAGGDNPMKAFEGKFKAIMADILKE